MCFEYEPLVSIVIPVFNGENYLEEALKSAIAQTYKNIEILVIDDGSVDSTPEIAKKYESFINYVRKENGGVATAINLALEKMKGEYFSWLSHDDLYLPNKIYEQIKYINENKLQGKKIILFSDYNLIDENGKFMADCSKNHDEIVEKQEYCLLRGHINGITMLIPKIAFDDYGGFDEELKCAQDYDLWWKMNKSYTFIHIPEILSSTRIHGHQDTQTNPRVEIEGNQLWIKMIDSVSDKRKIFLEGSILNYYSKMHDFLKSTPYKIADEHVKKKIVEEKESIKTLKLSETPLVSVIIPFYNRIDALLKAIESVLNQTYKNFEIILVDDCSNTDLKALNEVLKLHLDRIKLLKLEKNSGPAVARNVGIEHASGKYIAFLDSDDLFMPNKIEKQLAYMQRYGVSFSHTSYLRRGIGTERKMPDVLLSGNVVGQLISSCTIATPTVMVERELLMKENLRYKGKLRIGEDVCFWISINKICELLGIDEPLTVVNASENSTAYNTNKLFEGLKGILETVLSDKDLLIYKEDIGKLLSYIIRTGMSCYKDYEIEKILIESFEFSKDLDLNKFLEEKLYNCLKDISRNQDYIKYCEYKLHKMHCTNEIFVLAYQKSDIKFDCLKENNKLNCTIVLFEKVDQDESLIFLPRIHDRKKIGTPYKFKSFRENKFGIGNTKIFRNSDMIHIYLSENFEFDINVLAEIAKEKLLVLSGNSSLLLPYRTLDKAYFLVDKKQKDYLIGNGLNSEKIIESDQIENLLVNESSLQTQYGFSVFKTDNEDLIGTEYISWKKKIKYSARKLFKKIKNNRIVVLIVWKYHDYSGLIKQGIVCIKREGILIAARKTFEYFVHR